MKTLMNRLTAARPDRLRFSLRALAPALIAVTSLIVVACNNGSGASGY